MCERSYFKILNSRARLESLLGGECATVQELADVYYPSYEPTTRKCFLQTEPLLYSCVGQVAGMVRLCPCRRYIKGQTALCPECL